MSCPSHPPWLDHSNFTRRSVQVLKLLIMQLCRLFWLHYSHFQASCHIAFKTCWTRCLLCGQCRIKYSIRKSKQEVLGRTNRLPFLIRHGPHRKRSKLLATIRWLLQSRCLAKIKNYTYRHTDRWEGFMKHAVEMGSGAMIYSYVPSFIKNGSAIQKLIRGYTNTQTARRSHKPTFIFSK
jgi:hypothetical protein